MSRLHVPRIIPPLTSPEGKTVATRMKLLIVDDHVAMRRLIGRVVSDMVSEIEECGDGAEALDAYHRCLPDWVLMDIEMHQVDGITATRAGACGIRFEREPPRAPRATRKAVTVNPLALRLVHL